ncbi:PsiF family protein [Noviherbaspirillum sp. ST9]|uniref:PsiF family protein n=1 Tax=Noviherbaspirillum sp. ST9 TaxID=3401606 RepID=UPI003B586B10
MKKLAAALMLAVPFAFTNVHAATEQQNKMATCNKEAADKKGDERKAFMKECLSNKPKVSEAQKAQQEKMKTCNAEAKDKKGDERKKFMSECLKKG